MAKILILGTPRTDEDLTTYDFGRLVINNNDDGIWNFQDFTHSEASSVPNNNNMNADFDAGVEPGGSISPDSYLQDLEYYNFDEMAEDGSSGDQPEDDHKYDFLIWPVPTDGDPARLEYEFCCLDENPEYICSKFVESCFKKALREALGTNNIDIKMNEVYDQEFPTIISQMFFNNLTSKFYIEYDFNSLFKSQYKFNISRFISRFKYYINNGLKEETNIWPEIILIEDGRYDVDDYSWILSPFTIGYWDSIYGGSRFIADKAQIMANIINLELPVFGTSARVTLDDLYNRYYNTGNVAEFYEKYTETMQSYFDDINPPSTTTFVDYVNGVAEIRNRYIVHEPNQKDKDRYIEESRLIWNNYHNNIPLYQERIDELNHRYGIDNSYKNKVDDMFNEYNAFFHEIFGRELPPMHQFCFKRYYTVLNL